MTTSKTCREPKLRNVDTAPEGPSSHDRRLTDDAMRVRALGHLLHRFTKLTSPRTAASPCARTW